jgi:hypothetical protein
MKKLSLLLLVAVFFAACGTTPEKSAQKLIKAYMPTVIENYEPGTFGTLDSVFSRLECNPEYVKMQENLVAGQESLAQAEEQIASFFMFSVILFSLMLLFNKSCKTSKSLSFTSLSSITTAAPSFDKDNAFII